MSVVDAVLIGRNEVARLERCLASVQGQVRRIIYVDSGSRDRSVANAHAAGVEVVELTDDAPFSAARARNAGFHALMQDDPPDFVQFIDGDCSLEPGWIAAGRDHLTASPELGLVTGWRSEIHRDASLYNALCDFEWHRPAGPIDACGGDMMVRTKGFQMIGGFDPQMIAGEDEEFCVRLRKSGWLLERLPLEMTRHDAAMLRFGQWWSRAVRSGHAFAQVGHRHPDYFGSEIKRVALYGLILPLVAVVGGFFSGWIVAAVLAAYLLSYIRTIQGLTRQNLPFSEAARHASLLTLSKFPNLIGMAIYARRYLSRSAMRIIEYK